MHQLLLLLRLLPPLGHPLRQRLQPAPEALRPVAHLPPVFKEPQPPPVALDQRERCTESTEGYDDDHEL